MTKSHIISFILLLSFAQAFSQIRQAEKEMAVYNFTEAVLLLQTTLEKGNPEEETKIVSLLADCYRMLNDWPQAKTCYRRAISLGETLPENYYYLGQAYRVSGDYEEAQRLFLQCEAVAPGRFPSNHFAAACDSAIRWKQQKPGFDVQNMALLNSPQSEFGVVIIPTGLLFTSDRLPEQGRDKLYGWTGNSYLKLFLAEKTPVGAPDSFLTPEDYDKLSGHEWHSGPVSFNRGFTEVFINRTQAFGDQAKRDPERTRTHLLKIFTAEIKDSRWTKPVPFFLNNINYSVGHPALSPDGNTLFFVSNQPGGYGGTDIYQCNWTETGWGWGTPVNLGPLINTPGNEMFPFAGSRNELWFASDYHPGFGGLDLFVTRFIEDNEMTSGQSVWTTPVNPGSPLNSSFDDFSIWTDSTGDRGFFSSNRPGGIGADDIYSFARMLGSEPRAQGTEPRAQGTEPRAQDSGQLAVGSWQLDKPYLLENIYYDFDKWDIREDAKPALDSLVRIMKLYPVTIELGSHTDCRGTEEYNRELSQKRAESAVTYMIEQGIDPGRISAKGYGESMPVNACNCEPNQDCSEALHQANRRTGFKILTWGD
ncbi:MAG: OmpA family protein [Bacteroidales bacterium]|nr:OmpA family protein [Bacteroidales bacterium]